MTRDARRMLPQPTLMLITQSTRRGEDEGIRWMTDIVRDAALGGVNVVQLREKHLTRAHLIDAGLHVRDAITDRAMLFVNGDVEAAIALRADAVHLPEDGPAIAGVRDLVGADMLISRAVHDVDGAIRAVHEGADLVQIGTVFETSSKPGVTPLGVAGVRDVVEAVHVPVIAVGGITADNAGDVIRAGVTGIAVIGAIFDAPNPREAAAALKRGIAAAVSKG